jgi:hypothetical protein
VSFQVVAEKDGVVYPKLDTTSGEQSNAEGKHQKGLYFQVECGQSMQTLTEHCHHCHSRCHFKALVRSHGNFLVTLKADFLLMTGYGNDSRRELWVVYPDAAKKPFVELDLGITGAEKRGIMPPLLPRNRHLFGP